MCQRPGHQQPSRLCQLGHPWPQSPVIVVGCLSSQETPTHAKAPFLPPCLFSQHPESLLSARTVNPDARLAHCPPDVRAAVTKSTFHFTCGSCQRSPDPSTWVKAREKTTSPRVTRRRPQPRTGGRKGEILNVHHCVLQAFSDSSTPDNKASPTGPSRVPLPPHPAESWPQALPPSLVQPHTGLRHSVPVWTPQRGSPGSFS